MTMGELHRVASPTTACWWRRVFVLLAGCCLCATSARRIGDNYNARLCDVLGCECTTKSTWQVINCTFNLNQDVEIYRGSIPGNTLELYISGGNLLKIHAHSFRELNGFELLYVDGSKMVVLKEQAFDNIRTASVLDVHIVGCNYLLLENRAFKNMLTSIRTDISRCEVVEIRTAVFGRLQEAKIMDVNLLNLAEGAFLIENQTERGRHGVVTNISFHNVTIPAIPRRAFVSALSSIDVRNSHIEHIDSEAFAATDISAILFSNSHIGRLRSGALSQRTLIKLFQLRNCTVDLLESQAIMAAIINITVEFSSIKQVDSGAVNCSVTANIIISNNKLGTLSPYSFVFRDWNNVIVEHNIIQHLHSNFLSVPYNSEIINFSFSSNEIHEVEEHAFDSIPELQRRVVHYRFEDNSFHEDCRCHINQWLSSLMNDTQDVEQVLKSSYCKVNAIIANCFKIQEDLISMANYTQLVCGPGLNISCEPYNGVTKQISNSTFLQGNDRDHHKLSYFLLLVGLVALAVIGTIVIILIRGGLWLKKKGYCMRFKYAHEEQNQEDQGAMVIEEARLDYPELTNELLLELREQLQNPETEEKAREMIELLYERFVIDESYTNNNRQDEEAHLYEELGNMQTGNALPNNQHRTDDFLKVMAEKINFPLIDDEYPPPVVQQQYSEPADAAVHVYSELKSKGEDDGKGNDSGTGTVGSNGSVKSGNMALRPLPDKPGEAGPSRSKY